MPENLIIKGILVEVVRKIWRCICSIMGFMPIQVVIIFINIYLFMVIFPNYSGCLFPEKMCMVGTNKLNDVLVVTATVMPSLLVIHGYKIWRGQKAKELLATKAQEIYFNLDSLVLVLGKHENQINSHPETIKRDSLVYTDVKNACDAISAPIQLLKDLLAEENSSYANSFDEFYRSITFFNINVEYKRKLSFFGGKESLELDENLRIKEIVVIASLAQQIETIKAKLLKIILHK